ncbi:signal peptidase I [Undibacterium sp. TJN25]|uniref:signal peptidase I n=1 Tax=Undibacterium sp. TJN25 TaxID=3413056 RepID=UPI003BF091CE
MTWNPKPWISVVVSLICAPLGLLYAGRPKWALLFMAVLLALGGMDLFHFLGNGTEWIVSALQFLTSIAAAALAYRIAKAWSGRPQPWYSHWYYLLSLAGLAAFTILSVRIFLYEPFRIPSTAMEPTAEIGSRIIVKKWGYGHYSAYGMRFGSQLPLGLLKRGDIIVFDFPRDPSQTYVKRVVGLPGDRIDYYEKRLIVNARESRVRELDGYLHLDLPHNSSRRFREVLDGTAFDTLVDTDRPERRTEPLNFALQDQCNVSGEALHCTVPAGNYFVLGDNRDTSFDSRHWGFVRSSLIVGKVVKIIP